MTATIDLIGEEKTPLTATLQEAKTVDLFAGFSSVKKTTAIQQGYTFAPLTIADLQDVLTLQEQVIDTLTNKSWLRSNTEEGIKSCLSSQVSVGVRFGKSLVAAAVLYDGGNARESIRGYFTDDAEVLRTSVNLKLVLAAPGHRGVGLGRTLVEILHHQATLIGKKDIACTIHPRNLPSQALFLRLGYHHVGDVTASYGARSVFARGL